MFYLRNVHTDSCYGRNRKVTLDQGRILHKFLTPGPVPKEKRRILQESTQRSGSVATSAIAIATEAYNAHFFVC